MVRETRLAPDQLILPLFVKEGATAPIRSMPGHFQLSLGDLVKEAKESFKLGVPAVILFGIPKKKDETASEAYAKNGIVQKAVRTLKEKIPELVIITDLCLCEYMSHGHCGVVRGKKIDNDSSLELLAQTALSHVEAGADLVAPSDMMDGRVRAIRRILDKNSFSHIPIMSYAVKYASAFYGPFREAAGSAPKFGNRKSYQMDPANSREAIREAKLDIKEGADIITVKPALPYLDIIQVVRAEINVPVAAYQVSGEFAMIKAAAQKNWLGEKSVVMESLTAIRRAGADLIITYFAKEAAKLL